MGRTRTISGPFESKGSTPTWDATHWPIMKPCKVFSPARMSTVWMVVVSPDISCSENKGSS